LNWNGRARVRAFSGFAASDAYDVTGADQQGVRI
jgi:hypothetical protein